MKTKRMDSIKINRKTIYILAFLIPFFILGTAFALLGVYPFGSRQVMVIDAWQQYYPFLTELNRKLKNGESLLYCWRLGMGSDFASLIAYYLASPLNLLTVLVPENWLRDVFALLILIKVGFAGSFCAFALHRMNGKKDPGVMIFSTFYALCGWTIGYYWNIMWLDTFAILPLVACGIHLLVKERKFKLYTISLAVSILANYYMGLMVCIFTAFFFFVQCFAQNNKLRDLLKNLGNIIFFSVISIMMSAVVILPTLVTLQSTYKSGGGWGGKLVARGWVETLSNTFAYLSPTHMGGRPYLYCGVLCVVLLFVFYRISRISKREKTVYTIFLLLLFLSTNISVLDYIWHGFHAANSLPYRFTFIFAFLLVMVAYRAYSDIEELQKKDALFASIAGTLYYVIIAADQLYRYRENVGTESGTVLLLNFLLIAACLIIMTLFVRKKMKKTAFTLFLAIIAALELVPTVFAGTKAIWTTDRSSYPDRYDAVEKLLIFTETNEGDDTFYRTEFTEQYAWNEPVLYGYNGVSGFSSTTDAAVTELFEKMGLMAWLPANRYHYQNSTPVNNAFLNLKYFISRGSEIVNQEYLTENARVSDAYAYRNEAYLPVGFMVKSEMADFCLEGDTPFEIQNNLMKAASGIEEDVFDALDIIHVGHWNLYVTRTEYGTYHYQPSEDADPSANGRFKYNYEMPGNGCAYVFMELRPENTAQNTAKVEFEDESHSYTIYHHGTFFPAGTYKTGDLFSVCSEIGAGKSGDLRIFVSVLNQNVFDRAYDLLKDEVLEVTEFTSKSLKGTIFVKKDGLMYTSIPCTRGWKVYVDGNRADITPVLNAFMGVTLTEGEHTIEFVYSPDHVYLAVFISLLGVGIFAAVCLFPLIRRNRGLHKTQQ